MLLRFAVLFFWSASLSVCLDCDWLPLCLAVCSLFFSVGCVRLCERDRQSEADTVIYFRGTDSAVHKILLWCGLDSPE